MRGFRARCFLRKDGLRENQLALGHILALAVSAVWGTTYISTKVLLTAFHPVEILVFRFLLAWAVLFLCSPRPLLPKGFRQELPFVCCGLTGLTFYSILENYALEFSLASTVGLIIAAAPMFTALLLWLCRRSRRPGPAFFIGFCLAMAGIALISLAEGESFDSNPLGILLSLAAAICWGGYSVCLEWAQTSSGLSELQSTRKIFFWGLLFTLPFLWGGGLAPDLTRFAQPTLLGNTLYLGIGASALCFLAWNKASALILREPITALTLGAIALILAGLALSQRKAPPESL